MLFCSVLCALNVCLFTVLFVYVFLLVLRCSCLLFVACCVCSCLGCCVVWSVSCCSVLICVASCGFGLRVDLFCLLLRGWCIVVLGLFAVVCFVCVLAFSNFYIYIYWGYCFVLPRVACVCDVLVCLFVFALFLFCYVCPAVVL